MGDEIATTTPKMPSPPAYLNKIAMREWKRILPVLHQEGLVSRLDQANIGAYCMVVARIAEAEAAIANEGTLIVTPSGIRRANPWCAILNTSLRQLSALSGQLGLSPSARTHVKLSEEKLNELFEKQLRGG